MGVMKELKTEKRDRAKQRGSTDNAGRLHALLNKEARAARKADWSACDPRWLQAVVGIVTGLGGAVSFGYSRDGGAYSIAIFLDGDRETLWLNGGCDLDHELEQIWAMFGGV